MQELGIENCPIAYRKILKSSESTQGKCNIDFAFDVFELVKSIGDCCVVTLDISSFFECIDHKRLKQCWCDLLGKDSLPPDHFAVFKAVTNYSVVNREQLYERLGYLKRQKLSSGRTRHSYTVSKKDTPMQLCSSIDFREKVVGEKNLIQKNKGDCGIPQGSPISDLLANVYLTEFDVLMNEYAVRQNGHYFRYSDDLIMVIPGMEPEGSKARIFAIEKVKLSGSKLEIKASKTAIGAFTKTSGNDLSYRHIFGPQGKTGLEYLGFRFDGKHTYLRESTLSRFHRKITLSARSASRRLVRRYQGKSESFLIEKFNVPEFEQRFSRVKDFEMSGNYYDWTFWTYVQRAVSVFGRTNGKMHQQMKKHKKFLVDTVHAEIDRALDEFGQRPS